MARFEAAGRLLELDVALDLARQLAAVPPTPTTRLGALTARELEVAQLLARGLRNRQIADVLVITDKTAANHVSGCWRSWAWVRERRSPRAPTSSACQPACHNPDSP